MLHRAFLGSFGLSSCSKNALKPCQDIGMVPCHTAKHAGCVNTQPPILFWHAVCQRSALRDAMQEQKPPGHYPELASITEQLLASAALLWRSKRPMPLRLAWLGSRRVAGKLVLQISSLALFFLNATSWKDAEEVGTPSKVVVGHKPCSLSCVSDAPKSWGLTAQPNLHQFVGVLSRVSEISSRPLRAPRVRPMSSGH